MYTDDELDVDAELAELLRRAAGELPGYPGNLGAVARRRSARVRRRLAVAVAAALTAVVLVGAVPLLGRGNGAPPPDFAGGPPAVPRLFINGAGQSWEGIDGHQVGLEPSDALREVLPDGRLVTRDVPGLPAVLQAVTLPDGGFAALGSRTPTEPTSDHAPGASPTHATDAGGLSVAVVRPDGSVRYLVDTAAGALIGADDQRLYLWGGGVIALDLSTGRQQSLNWTDVHAGAELAGGRFAELIGGSNGSTSQPCTLWLLDAQTGTRTSERTLPDNDCYREGTALSPDGQWLAIAQPGPFVTGNINQLRLVLVDVDTGEQTEQVLDEGPAVPDSGQVDFQGMAWLDDSQVRVVWTRLPDKVDRMYAKSEVLRMKAVAIPGP